MEVERKYLQYVVNRFSERSTWNGLILIVSSIFGAMDPEQIERIIVLGTAVAGTINSFFPDNVVAKKVPPKIVDK